MLLKSRGIHAEPPGAKCISIVPSRYGNGRRKPTGTLARIQMADTGLRGVRLLVVGMGELELVLVLEEAVADSRSKGNGKGKGKVNARVEIGIRTKFPVLQVDARPSMAVLRLRIARVALLLLLALLLGLLLGVRIGVSMRRAR